MNSMINIIKDFLDNYGSDIEIVITSQSKHQLDHMVVKNYDIVISDNYFEIEYLDGSKSVTVDDGDDIYIIDDTLHIEFSKDEKVTLEVL